MSRSIVGALALILAMLALAPAALAKGVPGPDVSRPEIAAADSPATELRVALGRLLGEHAFLVMEAMRSTAEGTDDRPALEAALDANSAELVAAIDSVYGPEGAEGFEDLWQTHIDALLDYAGAVREGDQQAADDAVRTLDRYRQDFSAFLQAANPHLTGDAESHALQLHIDQLTAFADADYARSFVTQREAYRHMFALGDHLARAIADQFPDAFPGGDVAFSPAAHLRVDLDRLLGEHLILSAEAMRAGLRGSAEFKAAAEALDGNTTDLTAMIRAVYGDEGGDAFDDLWRRHTDAYLELITAVQGDDEAAREDAFQTLQGYHLALGEFLSSANPHLEAADVEAAISHHVTALIDQVEAHAAGDFTRSVTIVRDAYSHMFAVGDVIAFAIAEQFPDRFTDLKELPPTDATPPVSSASPFVLWFGAAVGLLWLVHLLSRGRQRRG